MWGKVAVVKYLAGQGADIHAVNKVSHKLLPV